MLWKRCGLASVTLSVCSLPAQDLGNGDEHCTRMSQTCKWAAVTGGIWYNSIKLGVKLLLLGLVISFAAANLSLAVSTFVDAVLGRIECMRCKLLRSIIRRLSVCVSVTRAGCAKTAERIDVLFRVETSGNPRNIVLAVVPNHHKSRIRSM